MSEAMREAFEIVDQELRRDIPAGGSRVVRAWSKIKAALSGAQQGEAACVRCGGAGSIEAHDGNGPDCHLVDADCPDCGGTGAPQPAQVPDFLLEMSKQMREQPNRMTSHPFWQVRCNRYLPTLEGCSEHHTEICGDDGVVYRSDHPLFELHEYLIENHEEWCQQWAEENHDDDDWKEAIERYFDLDCDDLPEELRRVPVQEIEEVVSTHLTQAGAEQFIKRKQHDYPKLFTYVESAYWSPQLRELQDWIISLTAAPSGDAKREAEELRKDAERYQWLRNRIFAADFDYGGLDAPCLIIAFPKGSIFTSDADATIDAARLRQSSDGDDSEEETHG